MQGTSRARRFKLANRIARVAEYEDLDTVTRQIIDAANDVHQALGPGLLESAYEACLAFELAERGLHVERQKQVPIKYKDMELDAGYRLDLLVDNKVVLELKAVENITPEDKTNLLTYLRLSGHRVGLLINFNVNVLRTGIQRVVQTF